MQDRRSRDPGQEPAQGGKDTPVPRLPRGSGFRLSAQSIFRILMFAALLTGVILLREPCANSAATFINQFETQGDAGSAAGPRPGQMPGQAPGQMPGAESGAEPGDRSGDVVPGGYVRITGDMSDEELENALRQAGVAFDDAGVPDAPGAPE